jgi:hypothetical protein
MHPLYGKEASLMSKKREIFFRTNSDFLSYGLPEPVAVGWFEYPRDFFIYPIDISLLG